MTTAAARLDMRLSPADKARIARAANLLGVTISSFVRDAALREAERSAMVAAATATLSPEESGRFLTALDVPFQPNARLEQAFACIDRA